MIILIRYILKSNMVSAKGIVFSARNLTELLNTSNVFGYIDAGIC